MALTDKKVTDALLQTGVVSAPDKLTGTAAENKAVFDRLMRNVAQSVINPVIDELVGEQGAANIGAAGGGTVQSRLDACELPAQSQEKADEALRAAKEYTDAHAARRDNPHGVDVGQIGAETPQGAQAKADAAQAAAFAHSDAHAGRSDNPHGVSVTQIGAETPSGAQSKVDAALTAARQYTDAEVKKQIAQAGAVAADGQGNAENANRLGDIPADNYLPETLDALNVLADTPHPYTATRPCLLRPSFRGRTVQEGVPSPENPAPIKGVLNPWARAYTGEAVQVTADVAPMMRLPDGTADRVVYRDGQWGVERGTIKIILDGKEFWGGDTTSELYYYVPQGIREEARGNLLCDKLAAGTVPLELSDYQICISWQGSIHIRIPESVVPRGNLDALKAWLAANPITVYGPAATPTFEPIPAWSQYGRIDPIAVTTTVIKPNPDAPISPDNVATITGTPVVTTGYRGMVRQLVGELFDGDGFDGVNLTVNGQVTRHNLDLPLTPGDWTIECGDDNDLLESMDVEVLPDPATYGHRVYPYQHSKAGNVHQLTGTAGAQEISFTASAPYLDGDTWTVNGAPVAVTYADGQELLPTAVIAGESVRATIEGDVLRLLREKPTPQPNLLDNGLFDAEHLVNQRGQQQYTGPGYATDRWHLRPTATAAVNDGYTLLSDTNSGNDPSMAQPLTPLLLKKGEPFTIAILCERTGDSPYGIVTGVFTGQSWGRIDWESGFPDSFYPEIGHKQTFVVSCVLDHDVGPGGYFSAGCRGTTLKIYAIKLEPGPRFTGWYEPKPGETLAECQRYLEPIFNPYTDYAFPVIEVGDDPNRIMVMSNYDFKVTKRAIPSLIVSKKTSTLCGRLVVRSTNGQLLAMMNVLDIEPFSQDKERMGLSFILEAPIPDGTHWITFDTLNTDAVILASAEL